MTAGRGCPARPVVPNIRFCLTATTDVDAEFDFRFDVAGILQLASLFELPEWVITKHRDRVHKAEALCILLHRLSHPKRLADMRKTFLRSEGALSRILLHMDMKKQFTFTNMYFKDVLLSTLMLSTAKARP
ncbi:hypothetical protein PRIC1_001130 [Phytophthora ramorum]